MKELQNEKFKSTKLYYNKIRLKEILQKGRYSQFKNDVGYVEGFEYNIQGLPPQKEKQYPIAPEAEAEIEKTVKELCDLWVLEQIDKVPHSLPIQTVSKPDGTYRLVHNLRALNRVSRPDDAESIRHAQKHKFKTCLDLANGLWSVPITEQSSNKACFMFKRQLPQGYKNSPNVFQTLVEKCLCIYMLTHSYI